MQRRVLVTRFEPQPLAELLAVRGLAPVHMPLIARRATGAPPPGVAPDYLLVTSPAACRFAPDLFRVAGRARAVAVGAATAVALEAAGLPVTVVGQGGGPGAVVALAQLVGTGPNTVWHVGGTRLSAALREALRAWAHPIHRWAVYETVPAPDLRERIVTLDPFQGLTFASGSAARTWVAAGGTTDVRVAVIGPDTAAATRAAGMPVHAIAATSDLAGLADAAVEALRLPPSTG